MRLSDIEVQEGAVRALRTAIKRSSVAHAHLFTGPRRTGKTAAALAFAAALNCDNPTPDGDACGLCMSCTRIQSCTDADVRLISPEKDQTTIEQMRDMIKRLHYVPLSGKYGIVIIEQADTLNPSSENCILKILEEPPPYGLLILLSATPNSLLPTIRSRCRTVRFRRASTQEVEAALRKHFDMPDDELEVIASCSQGAIGRAFDLAASPELMEERQAVLQALKGWAEGPAAMSIQTAEVLCLRADPKKNDPDERTRVRRLTEMLDHILSWYADLLALKVRGRDAPVSNADRLADLRAQVERHSVGRLRGAAGTIMHTRRYLEGNITPQLALENMFFDLRLDTA